MKNFAVSFLLIACGLCAGIVPILHAQVPDSCLKIWNSPYDSGFYWTNPDSVKIDSCESSPTFGEKYARGWFVIRFTYHILPTPPGPEDTLIYRTWHDIDSQYITTRTGFDSLEQRFGEFILRKFQPEWNDTGNGGHNIFYLSFNNYVNIDSADKYIREIPLIEYTVYEWRVDIKEAGIPTDTPNSTPKTKNLRIRRHQLPSLINMYYKDRNGGIPQNLHIYLSNGIKVGEIPTHNSETSTIESFFDKLSTGIYLVSDNERSTVLLLMLVD